MRSEALRRMNGIPSTGVCPMQTGNENRLLRPRRSLWSWITGQIDVTTVDLPVRGLPGALEGLVACQLSDLHVDGEADLLRVREAIEIIKAKRPDLLFLTGDYFSATTSMCSYLGEVRDLLREIGPPLGVYAVTGNHDHTASFWSIERELARAGVQVLENHSRRLEIHNRRLQIVGVGDLWSHRARPWRAFRGVASDDCSVVLVHNPDTAIYLRHLSPGVVVSGHTHGGIVRLPLYGALLRSFLRIGKRFYSGLNRYKDFYIYTNRGLGTFPLGVRVNCRPEVSVFTLVAAPE